MDIGIFGGTFDPVHNGHIRVAHSVLKAGALDQVRLIPANIPPHRTEPEVAASHRLAMVRLAIQGLDGLYCDERELSFPGPSFTVRTIESLAQEFTKAEFSLILGMDAFLGLPTWYRWREIPDLANIIVVNRPGVGYPEPLPDWWTELAGENTRSLKVRLIDVDPYDVSATELRQRLRTGQSVEGLLNQSVINYIQDNHLYV